MWNTNLSDSELTDLYGIIRFDPEIIPPTPTSHDSRPPGVIMSIRFHVFDKLIPFNEGACHCMGFNECVYAIYKTTKDWELWAARRQELDELREEQAIERQVERELVRATHFHLISQCTTALNAKDYEAAYACLCARAELIQKNNLGWDRADRNMRLASFPIDYVLKFLETHCSHSEAYIGAVGAIEFWRQGVADIDAARIYDAASSRFHEDGMMFKEICLFWERRRNYSEARRYCEIAVARNLKDDTKSGFTGRLKRIRKAEPAPSPYSSPAAGSESGEA